MPRLRKEFDQPWESIYTVLDMRGKVLGTVHRYRSPKARNVSNMGGVVRWEARNPDGVTVTPINTYRRVDAVEALEQVGNRPEGGTDV